MKIVVVGLGGIGSHLVEPLYRYLLSLGKEECEKFEISFVDGDKYEQGNAGRQTFAESLIGMNKAKAQEMIFNSRFSEGLVKVYGIEEYVGEENVKYIIPEGSIVFSCVDNHTCRRILSQHCQSLNDVILISGGNELYDGNVQTFFRKEGKNMNKTIEERHPEIGTTEDGDRAKMSCEELAQIPGGGQVIITNFAVSSLMLNMFYSYLSQVEGIHNVIETFFDVRGNKFRSVIS
ncbi:MAG: ThiF family adenylyltransferase [Melioribacteraceae bacterium]|nr:ThiF family adenylyltransferase [Melioribacteraceae bacterium]